MPGSTFNQGDVRFTLDTSDASDITVVLNHLPFDTRAITNRENIWKWDTESFSIKPPGDSYTRIFSNNVDDPRVIREPPVLDWWIEKTHDELAIMDCPPKELFASCIASMKRHPARFSFVEELSKFPELVDLYGRGRARPIADKFDALAPYRFSVAIENSYQPDYWTEKISDALLSYSVPLYWGAPNIGSYFPPKSFVWLPIDDHKKAIKIIRDLKEMDDFEDRLDDLQEARWNILNRYSLLGAVRTQIAVLGIVADPAKRKYTRIHGRRAWRGGWIRGVGLAKNMRALGAKLRKFLNPSSKSRGH